jgi:soluble lytic murein transglycosylase-like protein
MRPGKGISILLLALTGILGAQAAHAQLYKFTDEDGVTHYTSVKPAGQENVKVLNFPCYASDPKCSQLDWEHIPLNRSAFAEETSAAAEVFAVDDALIRAIIHAESAYQPDALSPKGAQGLMQLMPSTQRELEVADVYDPVDNIAGGTRYLAGLLEDFSGDVELATAAYNAGPAAVREHGGVPPYAETREYVRRVKILYRRYRSGS